MKKIIATVIIFLLVSGTGIFAQALLNTDKYLAAFQLKEGESVRDNDYVWMADNESYERFAKLNGKPDIIDTNLEFALLSYYSPPVTSKRPAGANSMLPANNARVSGLKLGAAVYKEQVEISYFDPGNTAAIARYDDMLQFIGGKGSITRQQIEQYYRNGIKSLVIEILDGEFNKIVFTLRNTSQNRFYYMTMIRNPQSGRYTLNYETPAVVTTVKTISAAARETLLNEMAKRTGEFSKADIDYVRTQAALIPAVAFQISVRNDAVNVITAFYLNPNQDTYNALKAKWQDLYGQKEPGQAAAAAFSRTLAGLSDSLADIGL